jgi:ABC-type bacteriocin/lantibiotic exporter with double-glycine peptidase domain
VSRALVLSTLLLLGAGCRSAPPTKVPYSATAVRLELPFVRQESTNDCGLASISALCRYWQVALPSEERASLTRRAAETGGLSGGELQTTLERLGFEVYLFQGRLDRSATGLYKHVDSGRPPLVMLSGEGNGPHYEILLGYDEPRGNVILLDPVRGEVLLTTANFEQVWARCNHFTLLASRGQEVCLPSGPDGRQRSGELPDPAPSH